MSFKGSEIIKKVVCVWELTGLEVKEPTIKTSRKRLLDAHLKSCFLHALVKEYVENTLSERTEKAFLITVGILIGIFKGVPKTDNSEKILEELRDVSYALAGDEIFMKNNNLI